MPRDTSDLLHGTLDLLVLKALSTTPMHGFGLSKWIEQRMAQPGAIMVAVGAGHLAGRDSVIDLLKRDGYRVRRLQ